MRLGARGRVSGRWVSGGGRPAGKAELVALGVGEYVLVVPAQDRGAEAAQPLQVGCHVGGIEVDMEPVLRLLRLAGRDARDARDQVEQRAARRRPVPARGGAAPPPPAHTT